jgi:tetratricopeptide (TPR) repeat protein
MRVAATLLELAAALARGRQERVPLVRDLARSLEETGELRRAEELLREVADDSEEAPSRFASLEVASLRDYTEATRASFEALQQAPKRTRDTAPDVAARAAIVRAEVSWTIGKYSAMAQPLERARVAARKGTPSERRSLFNSIFGWEARALLLGPVPAKDGIVRCRQILRDARLSHAGEAAVLAVNAGLHAMLGKFDDAREGYNDSRRIGEAFGLGAWIAALPLYSGPIELLAGRAGDAERELRRGYDALRRMGDRSRRATMAAFLAHALYDLQQNREAEEFARKSKELAAEDDAFTQVVWRGALAKVLARRGDCGDAIQHAQDAVDRASKTDGLNLRGDALLDQAKALDACGRSNARAKAKSAAALYTKKDNVVAERRAKAFIARLAS